MSRFRRILELAKASWHMILNDRSLLVYPVVSGIGVAILAALIMLPLAAMGLFSESSDSSITAPQIAALLLLYFVAYSVIIFCNSALIYVVMNRLNGTVAPMSGWAFARSRIRSILGFALISATVGVILNVISERFEGASRIIGALGGAAWSIATFLVVPVLVVEGIGPVDALKRSASLLKKTWGEQVIGSAGIGLVTGIATLIVAALGGGLIFLAALSGLTVLIVLAVAVTILAVALMIVISTAMDTIYRAAVYRYANNQPITNYEAADIIPAAFTVK
ncbi:MAG: DUF6159 family protein [Thermomicrobiales bacterium]